MFSPRFEYKYRLAQDQEELARRTAVLFMQLDSHCSSGGYGVNSLYFDTPSRDDLHEMDEGIALRSKVRLRCYSKDGAPPHFLELKKRFGTTILKTRAALSPDDAARLLEGGAPRDAYDAGRGRELDVIREVIDRRGMEPRVWIHYRREAFVSPWGEGSRMTLDTEVESQAADPTRPLQPAPECWTYPDLDTRAVLELKFLGSAPGWMQTLAHRLELRRVSVSKYGLGAFSLDGSGVLAHLVEER